MQRKKPADPEAVLLKMATLCSRSEQCEYDISQKLYKAGLSAEVREKILERLKSEGFVNNSRFAVSYARDKCRFQNWGPYKIRMMLASKRITGDDITAAIEGIEPNDWADAIEKTARGKARSLDLTGPKSREERIKLYKFLLNRGFESSEAMETVKKIIRERKGGEA